MENKNNSKLNNSKEFKEKKWLKEKAELADKRYGAGRKVLNLKEEKESARKEKLELEKLRKQKKAEALAAASKKSKDTEIKFGEYKPKLIENAWFRILLIVIVAVAVLVTVIIVNRIKNDPNSTPKEIYFSSEKQFYWDGTEDIPLKVFLNSSYKGDNKKIKITTSGASGVITLTKNIVESGELFNVKLATSESGFASGGTIRLIATALATNISTYIDILIDAPVTSIEFVESSAYKTELEVCDFTSFEAVARRGDAIIDSDVGVTGRTISYDYFYLNEGNGDYKLVADKLFERVAEGTGNYSKVEDQSLITVSGSAANRGITANGEGKVFVQASVKKWSDYNTGAEKDDYLTVVRQITLNRCATTSLDIRSPFDSVIELKKGRTQKFDFLSLLNLTISFDATKYSSYMSTSEIEQLRKDKTKSCYQFLQVEVKDDSTGKDFVQVSRKENEESEEITDGFFLKCLNTLSEEGKTVTLVITYVNPDASELSQEIHISLTLS